MYANDVLVATGNGNTSQADGGWIGTADLRYFTHAPTVNTTYRIVSFVGGTESDSPLYASGSVTVVSPPTPTPPPEPEPEPDIPPVNPNPNVFLTRANSVLLATTDGGGDVTEYRYRTSIADEWETYTGSELMLPAPDYLTFQVQARVSSGGIFTDWSQSAYSTSTATSPIKTFYP